MSTSHELSAAWETPVLLLVFNRPTETRRALDAISAIRPRRLYIAGDGPRPARTDDQEKVTAVRAVCAEIGWDCHVSRLYQEENMGCGLAVQTALNWFFTQEEFGIVIEDDVVAVPSFFHWAAEMLQRYRYDERVMAVCGGGYSKSARSSRASYYFSRLFDPWGWASWRRAWVRTRTDIDELADFARQGVPGPKWIDTDSLWGGVIQRLAEGKVDTWDYQWTLTIMASNGLVIYPKENLTSNIGFGSDATHFTSSNTSCIPEMAFRPGSALERPYVAPIIKRCFDSFESEIYVLRHFARTKPLRLARFRILWAKLIDRLL